MWVASLLGVNNQAHGCQPAVNRPSSLSLRHIPSWKADSVALPGGIIAQSKSTAKASVVTELVFSTPQVEQPPGQHLGGAASGYASA